MELIAKLMEDEETAEVVRSYNIGDRFRGYHAVMSNKYVTHIGNVSCSQITSGAFCAVLCNPILNFCSSRDLVFHHPALTVATVYVMGGT